MRRTLPLSSVIATILLGCSGVDDKSLDVKNAEDGGGGLIGGGGAGSDAGGPGAGTGGTHTGNPGGQNSGGNPHGGTNPGGNAETGGTNAGGGTNSGGSGGADIGGASNSGGSGGADVGGAPNLGGDGGANIGGAPNSGGTGGTTGCEDADIDGVCETNDCDDTNANVWVSCSTCLDADDDATYAGCDQYITLAGPDCDDSNAATTPLNPELANDGLDNDCSGADLLPSDATGIFVATTGSDTNPGTMAAPMSTITAAIAAAQASGRSVFVAEGDYSETLATTQVSIYGGYEATSWTRDISTHLTRIFAESTADSQYTTVAIGGGSIPLALEGFTIVGPDSGVAQGTAVSLTGGARISVAHNVISGGVASSETYGIRYDSYTGNALLLNNTVDGGNGANGAYGVELTGSGTTFATGNTISGGDNTSSELSAGIFVADGASLNLVENPQVSGGAGKVSAGLLNDSGNAILVMHTNIDAGSGSNVTYAAVLSSTTGESVLLNNNLSGAAGTSSAGLYLSGASHSVINNWIEGGEGTNTTGVTLDNTSAILANNTILAGLGTNLSVSVNAVFSGVAAINNILAPGTMGPSYSLLVVTSQVTLHNNAVGGTCALYDSDAMACLVAEAELNDCSWSGCSAASSNINSPPELTGPHLDATSPCIDAGMDPAAYFADSFADIDGDARPSGSWDIGADEYVP